MRSLSIFALFPLLLNYSFAQKGPVKIITAQNVGLPLDVKSEATNYWEPMHRLPLDFVFKCKIWKNKDLSITYSDTGKVEEMHLTHEYDDFVKELPEEINGYKLFGAYRRDDAPWNLFFIVYLSASKPNSYLYMAQSIDGGVWGGAYYSNDTINPFHGLNLFATKHFKTKALITHGTATIERQN